MSVTPDYGIKQKIKFQRINPFPAKTNFTPISFRLSATALPMPLLAPVMIATLSPTF